MGGDGDQGQTGHAQVQHVAGVCITGFIVLEPLIIRLADRKPFLVRGGIDTTTHNYQQQILLTAVERFVTDFSQDWSEISFVGLDQIQKMN